MKRKSLRTRLGAGEVTIGSWLSLADAQVCEMMTAGPFEWLVVDMEHTTTGSEQMGRLVQITSLAGVDALVRVGRNDDGYPVAGMQVASISKKGKTNLQAYEVPAFVMEDPEIDDRRRILLGGNEFGQLGDDTTNDRAHPIKVGW